MESAIGSLRLKDTTGATELPIVFQRRRGYSIMVAPRRRLYGRLRLPAVWEIPPAVGVNEGTAGIAFGAEDNPDQIGGQRADNLVVTDYESLTELPIQE
jgi:hypothetical protein